MDKVIISQASIADMKTIQLIGRQTFSETFASANTKADMDHYLAQNFSDEKVASELSNTDSLFYIACIDEKPIGYLKLNVGAAQTELQEEVSVEIERIYVLQAYHGKRVGQALYQKALDTAIQHGKTNLWLGVWEENHRAIQFYIKNGFVPFDKHIFKLGADEQVDILMRKVLK
jgi:ribosomal protein S18 acetylase RimI-like enzyme